MFLLCVNLEKAPELPATSLADNCYAGMFSKCEKLEEAPALPAQELAERCYNGMFSECGKLKKVSVGFKRWAGYTLTWLNDVAEQGLFVCPESLPEEYGENRIPEGWNVKKEFVISRPQE